MKKLLKNCLCLLVLSAFFLTSCELISSSKENEESINYDGKYKTINPYTNEQVISQKPFNNPDSGFYKHVVICLTPSGITNSMGNNFYLGTYEKNSLVHLRCDISKFSANANAIYHDDKKKIEITDCADQEIPSKVVNDLQDIINQLREQSVNAIIRFCYSPNFSYVKNESNSIIEVEPSLELMLKHIKSLEPILKNNPDVLSAVEVGMLGPWGEMHSTTKASNQEIINALINNFLEVTSEKTCILLRQPKYIYNWIAGNNDFSYDVNTLPATYAKNSNKYGANRIGLYNDGYLGSESDTGTYKNRTIEQEFLFYLGRNAMYGGEVIIGDVNTEKYREYNFIKDDIFKTHLSYLNIDWDNTVIENWKNTNLENNETLFEYVKKHMGARLILQELKFPNQNIKPGTTFELSGKIKNDGAGNIIKEKVVELLFVDNSTSKIVKEISLSNFPNVTTWYSKNPYNNFESNIYDFNINITVPTDLENAKYQLYLRLRTPTPSKFNEDKTRYCFRFAGSDDYWNQDIQANLLTIVEINSNSN